MNAFSISGLDRRVFLASAGLFSGALAATPAVAAPASAASAPGRPPADVGRKFNPDGSVRPFLGNTFVGHLARQGEDFTVFDTLLDVYREVPRHAFTPKLAMLPPSSYHVTLFVGTNDEDRHSALWPAGIDRSTPLDEVHATFMERLKTLPPFDPRPYDFEVDVDTPTPLVKQGSIGLPLRPADEHTADRLRAQRDRLSRLLGVRRPDHDHYHYHASLAYITRFLDPDESLELQTARTMWAKRMHALGRPIRIHAFYFCTLRDMYAFRELVRV